VWEIDATAVPQLDPLELWPEALARGQLWGLGGEALHMEPWRRAIGQELCDAMTAVDGRAVPDDHHRARHLPPPGLETRDHSVSIESTGLAVAGELALG
jgi:hypothetical protein